jgi:flagella basal body P-ring formation protein FlgA
MMSGRFRAIVVVIGAAAIAFGVYRNYHHHYGTTSFGPITVLVANRPIQKGTSGDVIRSRVGFYRVVNVRTSQIEAGAIVDPSTLVGKVAVKDVPAGQQLTAADFDPLGKRRELFPKDPLGRPHG